MSCLGACCFLSRMFLSAVAACPQHCTGSTCTSTKATQQKHEPHINIQNTKKHLSARAQGSSGRWFVEQTEGEAVTRKQAGHWALLEGCGIVAEHHTFLHCDLHSVDKVTSEGSTSHLFPSSSSPWLEFYIPSKGIKGSHLIYESIGLNSQPQHHLM